MYFFHRLTLAEILKVELQNIYQNFNKTNYNENNCFLCGNFCETKTQEHIFPKWLQKNYSLWNQKLLLINNSKIPYRNLTVTCCNKCNNEHLSKLEKDFQTILIKPGSALSFEEEIIIFQWCAKILYATRYKELTLLADRSNIENGFLITPEELESYSSLHLFLQTIRYKFEFIGQKPWSIFVFNCDDDSFFYQNNLKRLSFFIKFGKRAFCILFEDNNEIEHRLQKFKNLTKYTLNNAQITEVLSYLFYGASLRKNTPKYLTTITNNHFSIFTTGKLIFDEWNNDIFGINFYYLLIKNKIPVSESIHKENCSKITFLVDEKGINMLK